VVDGHARGVGEHGLAEGPRVVARQERHGIGWKGAVGGVPRGARVDDPAVGQESDPRGSARLRVAELDETHAALLARP